MGKSKNSKHTNAKHTNAKHEQKLAPEVEQKLAEDMDELLGDESDLHDESDGEQNADDATTGDKPKKDAKPKTWLDHQIERMKRASQHALLNAQIIRANASAANVDPKVAEQWASLVETGAREIAKITETFLAKLPAGYEGIVPTRTGVVSGPRKGFLKGVKVRMSPAALKSFSGLFTVDELADLTVESTQGKMIRLVTATKATIVCSSKQIEALEAKAA